MKDIGFFRKLLIIGAFLVLLGVIIFAREPQSIPDLAPSPTLASLSSPPSPSDVQGMQDEDRVRVIRVVDGDTIVLDGNIVLRYIGIDTPEISGGRECFAEESTLENQRLVLGKEVYLQKDVSETDRYGRLLRYVWVEAPDNPDVLVFVNEHLVKEGYANSASFPPDIKYQGLFVVAQQQARQLNKGLWDACGTADQSFSLPSIKPQSSPPLQQISVDEPGDNKWNCSQNTYNCPDFSTQSQAQTVFELCGGTGNDVHKLDRDQDGRVCETLP